ncbi:MAG: hypothetical protein K6L75_08275 [Cellvibrionaceae bacterium]
MAKGTGKRLTDSDIEKAVELLDGWSGKLTWDIYLSVLEADLGHRYTKAAMLRHDRIKSSWDAAKSRVRSIEGGHGSVGLRQANKRIHELNGRLERLTNENHQLLEQFVRWSHNAVLMGMKPEELDRPLPSAN